MFTSLFGINQMIEEKFKMSEKEYMEDLGHLFFKHLFAKHRTQYYLHRNTLKDEMLIEIDGLLNEDLNIKPILSQIKMLINNIRNGSGSLLHCWNLTKRTSIYKVKQWKFE